MQEKRQTRLPTFVRTYLYHLYQCIYLYYFSFTNSSFNRSPAPGVVVPKIEQPDQELNTVTIHKRGTTVGYDNPGFDSPWVRSGPRLSTLEWPDSPAIGCRDSIVCDGSSTPTNRQKTFKPLDTDSAYDPSYDPSMAAVKFYKSYFIHNLMFQIFRFLTMTTVISPLMMTRILLLATKMTRENYCRM